MCQGYGYTISQVAELTLRQLVILARGLTGDGAPPEPEPIRIPLKDLSELPAALERIRKMQEEQENG